MKFSTVFIIVLFTLLTLSSTLPMNQLIDNQNKDILKQNQSTIKNLIPNQESKLNSIINQKTGYTFGDVIRVSDVVNMTHLYNDIYPPTWHISNIWFVPDQQVQVYIGVDPCQTRDTSYNCIPGATGTHKLSDFQLSVHSGSPVTNGTDKDGNLEDDYRGEYPNPNSGSLQVYTNALLYNFTVNTPSSTVYSSLFGSNSSNTIYEFYPGNKTYGIPGWDIKKTNISFSGDSQIQFVSTPSTSAISAFKNETTFDYVLTNSGNPLPSAQVDFNITDGNQNNKTVCTDITSCLSYGFIVNQNNGTGTSILTGSSGQIYFNVSFASLYKPPESIYFLNAKAVLINPTASGAIDYGTILSLTLNKTTSVELTVLYNLQTPTLSKDIVPGFSTNLFPFLNTNNPAIRPGNYFEGYVKQSVLNGTLGVQNAPLVAHLYDSVSHTDYTSALNGGFASLTFPNGNVSNSNGDILFNLSLSYSAPKLSFNLVFTGYYQGMTNSTPYWIKTVTNQNNVTYQFTVSNLYDIGSLTYVQAFPYTTVKPTTSLTTMIIEFKAMAILNSTYSGYASNYPLSLPNSPYPLVNLPVSATITNFQGGPLSGITLGVQSGTSKYNSTFFLTNANGYINFTLTTQYPNLYLQSLFNLQVNADFGPMITANLNSFRFTRTNSSGSNSTTVISPTLSFNPQYTVIGVKYILNSITGNTNAFQIRPGDSGYFEYMAYNTSNPTQGFANIPFNSTVIVGQNTPGLIFNSNSSYLTQTGGIFFLFFSSTYGITNETATPFTITTKIILDIKAFNATNPDSNFYMGTSYVSNTTFAGYSDTWTQISTSFSISANYLVGKPVWIDPITDKQVLDPTAGINLVRPNNETIIIRLKVVYVSNLTPISNYQFPVSANLYSAYQGVSLTISSTTAFTQFSPGWYFTNTSSYIDFNLTITYLPGYSKIDSIKINATVDFGNGICVSSCNPNLVKWIVGQDSVPGYNLSVASTSTFKQMSGLLNVTKNPGYVTGLLSGYSVSPSRVQPGKYLTVYYRAYIPQTDVYATKDGLTKSGNLPLKGITVYLNETILSLYNMNVTQNGKATDNTGLVSFQVGVSNSALEGFYQLTAYADYENDQQVSTNGVTNKTGTFNYLWLNGTISTVGYYKTATTIKNYSPANTTNIEVKRAHTTTVTVDKIFNSSGNLITTNPVSTEVMRNYKLQITTTYTDQYNSPLSGYTLDINITTNKVSGGVISDIYQLSSTTNSSGQITQNITIKNTYSIGNAIITAYDPTNTTVYNINELDFSIISQLHFTGVAFSIPKSSNEAFVGENISITGSILDDLNQMGTNYYRSDILNELINSLSISGYDAQNNLITGSIIYKNFTLSTTSVSFSVLWQVPNSYTNKNLSIQLDIYQTGNIVHFISNQLYNSILLPNWTPYLLNVFQSVNYIFTLSHTDASNVAFNGKMINITIDYTGAIDISGTLQDNFGRYITNRAINLLWNSTSLASTTNNLGQFTYTSFIPKLNQNSTYVITISFTAPNSTVIDPLINNALRIVHDYYAPTMLINQGISNGSYQYQNINFIFNITDPSYVKSNYVAASGLNKNSVQLLLNGTVYWDGAINGTSWNGISLLNIAWFYSSINNSYNAVNLTLKAIDNAGNLNSISFIFKIDRIAPTFFNITPSTNVYLYQTNYRFSFDATDQQTGLNPTTAGVYINGIFHSMTNTSNYYVSAPISFYRNMTTFTVYFTISDSAGNINSTTPITILFDSQAPSILNSNTNLILVNGIYYAFNSTITFAFNVTDAQTGINRSNILLLNSANQVVFNSSQMQITNFGAFYTISGTLTRNNLNLTQSVQTLNFEVFDNYGNTKNQSLVFRIDILGPLVSKTTVYQPDLNTQVTSGNNLTATMQYVTFDLTDQGTPATGIDTSNAEIQLTVNQTFFVTLTIQNGVLHVSNSTLATNFTINFTATSLTIGWNATSFKLYGISQTYSKQQVSISWQILTLKDKFGNNIVSNTKNTVSYYMEIPALPPGPNILVELGSLALTFGIFIVIGVVAAYIFEKIRYVG